MTPQTPTGKRLLEHYPREHDWSPRYQKMMETSHDLIAHLVPLIEREAAQQERDRLRAKHKTWEGHPTAGHDCGICSQLLADPEDDLVEPPSESLWSGLPRSRWEPGVDMRPDPEPDR